MRTIRRSWIADGLMAASSACAVGLGLLLIDDRVQQELSLLVQHQQPSAGLVSAGGRAQDVVMLLLDVAHDQAMAHAPLALFALAALLLFVVMLRT